MSRLISKSIFAAILILTLLIGLGFWFYRSTHNALERAEAFAFRRMTVAQQNTPGIYRFFYASNRRLDPGNDSPEDRFTNERGNQLQFGAFDTGIDSSLALGMIINPTDWFQNDALQVNDIQPLDQQSFVKDVRSQVEASPHRALLVVVHGYRNSFPTSLRMTALVAHVLDVNAPVMMLDWPGDQGGGMRGYRRAQTVAHDSGPDLADTLDLIAREIQPNRIWLMANSMGAQVVADAFTVLYERNDWADTETEIDNVVLTAPDVSRNEFNNRFKNKINALAQDLTVYVSSNDRALLASRIVNRGRRLGEAVINPNNPDQIEEAAAIADLIEPGDDRITLIDVTPVNRTRNFHNFSLETPEFFDDLFLRLTNEETPRSRMTYPFSITDNTEVWVLTRGR